MDISEKELLETSKFKQERLFKLAVRKIDEIPILKSSTFKIIELANNPSVDVTELALAVEQNPSIVLKLLHLANTAYFRSQSPIICSHDAIVRIGLNNAKSLIIAIAMTANFDISKTSSFDIEDHWLNSMLTATLCRELSILYKQDFNQNNLVYTIGLLHNLGVFIIASLFPLDFYRISETCEPLDPIFSDRVKEFFLFSDYQALSWLLRRWEMPEAFVRVIGTLGSTISFETDYLCEIDVVKTAQRLARYLIMEDRALNDQSLDHPQLENNDGQFQAILNKTAKDLPTLKELAKSF